MASRPHDWFRQAERDMEHARRALEGEAYEWACFASHQAAEKASKAVFQLHNAEAWGHAVAALLRSLPDVLAPDRAELLDDTLVDAARELDRHYIPTRDPDAHPEGAPFEYYTRADSERATEHAGRIVRTCASLLAGPPDNPVVPG